MVDRLQIEGYQSNTRSNKGNDNLKWFVEWLHNLDVTAHPVNLSQILKATVDNLIPHCPVSGE